MRLTLSGPDRPRPIRAGAFAALALLGAHGCGDGSATDDASEPSYPGNACDADTQIEFTQSTPLLETDGSLAGNGWARHAVMDYDRNRVADSKLDRRKEWDFYAVLTPDYFLGVTIADISWTTMGTVDVADFATGETYFALGMGVGGATLGATPYETSTFDVVERHLAFDFKDDARTLRIDFPEATGSVHIDDDADDESLAAAIPFSEPGSFFYENKIFARPATGSLQFGDLNFEFPKGESFAVLDWGRGVWPGEFEWGWAVAAGTVDGVPVGFNIGFGDGDDTHATGNALLVNGVLHKLCGVDWKWPEDNIMDPWTFSSPDGRLEMTLEPIFDQSNDIDIGSYYVAMEKVIGRVSGRMVLDDGSVVEIEDFIGFAEHAFQRW